MATDYKLRSMGPSTSVDEISISQKNLEDFLLSEEFVSKISVKICEKLSGQLQKQVDGLNKDVKQLRTELSEAKKKIEELEQYSRSNNLRIFGVKEHPKENVDEVVVKLCKEELGLNIHLHDIDVAHRLKSKEGTTRPIIVRFVCRSVKRKIFSNKSKLKGTRTIIKEDLTPFRISLLKKLSSCSPKQSYWTSDGRIFSKMGNNIHLINSFDDITNLWGTGRLNLVETDSGRTGR
ncbi:l1 transposable element-related [Holotrichia oblita]|uniref:L1 transposable element-related n=1 Tax=Holotrichia oblita TaxID=644536 RepID=A0ACB9TIM7_HOLOL|nr:l1 transposable element-related [Holotrichia oblita]